MVVAHTLADKILVYSMFAILFLAIATAGGTAVMSRRRSQRTSLLTRALRSSSPLQITKRGSGST